MKCIVCVKQVPDGASVEVDPVTGVLKRDGTQSKLNPYDLYAIEVALELKEICGATVDVITMGPGQAKEALRECMCMGADGAGLLSDRKFAGADVLATSYTIAQGIGKMGTYDLIFCGKQTTDGDTAQVGPEVAQWLEIPHAANVLEIQKPGRDRVTVRMNMDGYEQIQTMALPCLLTIDKDVNTPRLPSYKRERELAEGYLREFSLADLEDREEKHYGLSGSPTQVERIFPPEKNEYRQIFEGTPAELAGKIHQVLKETKFL